MTLTDTAPSGPAANAVSEADADAAVIAVNAFAHRRILVRDTRPYPASGRGGLVSMMSWPQSNKDRWMRM
jgi:hypothetical protein